MEDYSSVDEAEDKLDRDENALTTAPENAEEKLEDAVTGVGESGQNRFNKRPSYRNFLLNKAERDRVARVSLQKHAAHKREG